MKTFGQAIFSAYRLKLFLSALFVPAFMGMVYGQLSINAVDTAFTITFDSTVAGVNNGAYNGTGFLNTPGTGQLDADAWEIIGLTGDKLFSDENIIDNDYTGGTSTGGVGTGGLYAFDISNGGTPDWAFGWQATGEPTNDMNPGDIKLRVQNNTGNSINVFEIAYDIYEYNNGGRSSTVKFYYSVDDSSYTEVSDLTYNTQKNAPLPPYSWISDNNSSIIDLSSSPILDGGYFYVKWRSEDNLSDPGSDDRDEIAIDNISISISEFDQTTNIDEVTQPNPASISSLTDTKNDAIPVFSFNVQDQGGDGGTTNIKTLRITPGPNNNINWVDHIQGIRMDNGSYFLNESNVVVDNNFIDISFNEGEIVIPDGRADTLTLRIYLNSPGLIDNGVLQFKIDTDTTGFSTYATGSSFAGTFTGATSNQIIVDVTATQLAFTNSNIPNVCIGEVPTTVPIVQAQDANGNLDVDFNGSVTLNSTPTASNNSVQAVNGITTFPNVFFTESGSNISFEASGGSLSTTTSNAFDVILEEVENEQATAASGQVTLEWTNPSSCFTDVLVLVSESSISYEPTETSYTYNLNYGVGDEVETGVFAVYQGSEESPQTITGLSNDTQYFFKIFTQYNGYWSEGTETSATPEGPVEGLVTWDFEDGNVDPETGTGSISASAGTGPTIPDGELYYTSWLNDGDYYEITCDATGRENLRLIFDHKSTDAGPATFQVQYFDGSAFQNIGTPVTLNSEYANADIDLSTYSFLNNNTSATVRLTVPTAATDGKGRFYLDNVVVQGSVITPSNLVITDINGSENIVAGMPFDITMQAQDENGIAADVIINTEVQLSVQTGTAENLSGTLTATILAGASEVTLSNISYNTAETGVALAATRTSGDNLSAGTTAPFTVLATEPGSQVNNITFSDTTQNAVTLNWNRGNGENVIILAKQGAAVDADPVDGASYTANAAFATGDSIGAANYVVYLGTGTGVTITGLTANQEYHFAAYELNGAGGTENYLLTPATAGVFTCVAPTTEATDLTFSNIASGSMTLSWTNGGGQNRYVVVNNTNAFTAPTNGSDPAPADNSWNESGEQVVYAGTGSSVTVTGLTAGNTYHFKIYEYNCSGAQTHYSAGSTVASQSTALLVQGFGNCSLTGWENLISGNGNGWVCGSGVITANNVGANGPVTAWLISPKLNLDLLDNPALTFDSRTEGADEGEAYPQLTVWYSTDYSGTGNPDGNGATWMPLNYDPSDFASGVWASSGLVDLSGINSQVYIGFKYVASGIVEDSATTWQIDNIRVEDNVCGDPAQASGLVFSNIEATHMTVSWTAGGGNGRLVLAKAGAAVDAAPVDNTTYSANPVFGTVGTEIGTGNFVVYAGTDNIVAITGLTSNVDYHFRVFEYNHCNGSDLNYNTSDVTAGNQATLNESLSTIVIDSDYDFPGNIDYISYSDEQEITTENSVEIAGFIINDNNSDELPTELTGLEFTVLNWENLYSVALYDSDQTAELAEVTVTEETVAFSNLSISAPDNGGTKEFYVRVNFKSTVTDNEQIQFTVTSATANAAGTLFIDAAAGGAQTPIDGGENTIEVTADSLEFTSIPGNWYVNVPFEVSVQAVDALGNVDLDETSNVSLSATGTGTLANGEEQLLSSGAATFSGVTYDAAETINISTSSGFASQATQEGVAFENALTFFDFTGYHVENDGDDDPAYYHPALYAPVFENGPNVGTSDLELIEDVFTADGFDKAIVTPTEDYYLEFSLVPVESNTMTLTAIQFEVSRSPAGPVNLVLRSSIDDFSNNVESAVIFMEFANNEINASFILADPDYTNANDTVTFRIYAYKGSDGDGTIKVDNLVALGSASDISSPTFTEGYPNISNITTTRFTMNLNVTEPGTAYYVVQDAGTIAPGNSEAVKTGATGSISIGAAAVDSTVSIMGLTASTAYDVYFVLEDADGNLSAESIPLANVVTANQNSGITAVDPPIAGGAISSIADTEAEAVEVFAFVISDIESTPDDTLATRITKIKVNSNNDTDLITVIGGITLSGNILGSIPLTPDDYTIYQDSIVIDFAQSLNIPDNTSDTLTLGIWLLESGLTDNTEISFIIPTTHGFETAVVNSSQFVENIGSAITSEVHSIQVAASALSFTSVPSSVSPATDFTISITAVDENGNMDIDEISNVTLVEGSGGGELSSATDLSKNLISGELSWNDVQYSQADDFFTIIAQSATLTGDTTEIITSGSPANLIVTTNQTISDALTITGNVEIQATGNLTLEPGAVLNLGGNFTNNGTFTDQGGTTVFNGSAAQTIDGAAVTTFYNLTISNTTGVTSEDTLQLVNTLKLNAGALFDADGANGDKSFTLLSTASNTARIAEVEDGATLSGNVTMQRYMGTGLAGWRFIATPIKGQDVTSWHPDDLTIQGTDISHPHHDQQLYIYNESKGTDGADGADGWVGVTESNFDISEKALRLYLFNSSFGGGALTLDNTGAPFIGDGEDETAGTEEYHTVNLSFTPSAYDGGGWNLVANPYPSEIDWEEVVASPENVESAIYVWNPQIANYGMYTPEGAGVNGVSQYIASGQSFFIKVTAPGQSITFQESDKSDQDGASFLRKAAPTDLLKIHVKAAGKIHQDELIIRLDEDASDAFDLKYDAYEMASGWINLSSKDANNTDLAINTLKKEKGIKTAPLSAFPYYFGNYTMTFKELNTFNNGTKVYLRDKYLGETELISNKEKYNFTISKSVESSFKDRFEVVFAEPVSFYLEAQSGKVGEEILVYVKAEQFKDVAEAHMGFSWDADALTFTGIGEGGIASITEADFDLSNAESGNLRLNWQDDQLHELPDDATVVALRFRIVGNDDETTVSMDESPFRVFSLGNIEFPVIKKPDAVVDILRRGFVAGKVLTEGGAEIEGVNIQISGDQEEQAQSTPAGDYTFELYENGEYTVRAFESSGDQAVGINLLDVIRSRRYLAGIQPLENNYRIIAADVDGSKSIDDEDIEALKDLALQRAQILPLDQAWLFIPTVYDLSEDPFNYDLSAPFGYADEVNIGFTGVKLGDVDLSYLHPVAASGTFNLQSQEFSLERGEEEEVIFYASQPAEILAYQLMISWDPATADLLEVSAGRLNGRLDYNLLAPGKMLVIWEDGSGLPGRLEENAEVLSLRLRANREIKSSLGLFTLSTVESESLVVDDQLSVLKVAHTEVVTGLESGNQPFVLLQNAPNPVKNATTIRFYLPASEEVVLTIVNIVGEKVFEHRSRYKKGWNTFTWMPQTQSFITAGQGVYLYSVKAGQQYAVKKMIVE